MSGGRRDLRARATPAAFAQARYRTVTGACGPDERSQLLHDAAAARAGPASALPAAVRRRARRPVLRVVSGRRLPPPRWRRCRACWSSAGRDCVIRLAARRQRPGSPAGVGTAVPAAPAAVTTDREQRAHACARTPAPPSCPPGDPAHLDAQSRHSVHSHFLAHPTHCSARASSRAPCDSSIACSAALGRQRTRLVRVVPVDWSAHASTSAHAFSSITASVRRRAHGRVAAAASARSSASSACTGRLRREPTCDDRGASASDADRRRASGPRTATATRPCAESAAATASRTRADR